MHSATEDDSLCLAAGCLSLVGGSRLHVGMSRVLGYMPPPRFPPPAPVEGFRLQINGETYGNMVLLYLRNSRLKKNGQNSCCMRSTVVIARSVVTNTSRDAVSISSKPLLLFFVGLTATPILLYPPGFFRTCSNTPNRCFGGRALSSRHIREYLRSTEDFRLHRLRPWLLLRSTRPDEPGGSLRSGILLLGRFIHERTERSGFAVVSRRNRHRRPVSRWVHKTAYSTVGFPSRHKLRLHTAP